MVVWFIGSVICCTADCEVETEMLGTLFLFIFIDIVITLIMIRIYSYYLTEQLTIMEERLLSVVDMLLKNNLTK